jgi:aspartokinase
MIRLSDTLKTIVSRNPLLLFGLGHRLLNLTQTSEFLQPVVESRAKKEVKSTAILMGLSRLQRNLGKSPSTLEHFKVDKITIHSDLCSISYPRHPELQGKINRLLQLIEKKQGYVNVTEGMHEVTLLIDQDKLEDALRILGEHPKNRNSDIASIGVQYNEKYNRIPGMLYQIIQQLALQSINLLEIASTHTEFIFYVPQKDVHLAFDTLYNAFGKKAE